MEKRLLDWGRLLWPMLTVMGAVAFRATPSFALVFLIYSTFIILYVLLPWHSRRWIDAEKGDSCSLYHAVRVLHVCIITILISVPAISSIAILLLERAPSWVDNQSRRIVIEGKVGDDDVKEYQPPFKDMAADGSFVAVSGEKCVKASRTSKVVEMTIRPFTFGVIGAAATLLYSAVMFSIITWISEILGEKALKIKLAS